MRPSYLLNSAAFHISGNPEKALMVSESTHPMGSSHVVDQHSGAFDLTYLHVRSMKVRNVFSVVVWKNLHYLCFSS